MWSYNDSAKNSRVWALECERKSVGKSPGIGIPNERSEEWRQNTYAPTIHWVVVSCNSIFQSKINYSTCWTCWFSIWTCDRLRNQIQYYCLAMPAQQCMLWCLNTSWYLSLTANQQQNEHGHTQGKPERGPGKKNSSRNQGINGRASASSFSI